MAALRRRSLREHKEDPASRRGFSCTDGAKLVDQNGYCRALKTGDRMGHPHGTMLIFDQCKECGVKNDLDGDEFDENEPIAATATPAMTATAKASPLSLNNSVRASIPSGKASKLSGENPAVSVLIAAAAIGGIIVATSLADNGDSTDSN